MKNHIHALIQSGNQDSFTSVEEYKEEIIKYVGNEDLVNFCFDLLLNDIDIEHGEKTKWSDVCPKFSFIQLQTTEGKTVKISLRPYLGVLFEEAWQNRTSDFVFENQYALVIRIGAIMRLTTGVGINDFKYIEKDSDFTDITKNNAGQTRLCLEPWQNYSVALKGEVIVCSQLPALWNLEAERETVSGIEHLQKSLLEGNLNCICRECTIKPLTSIESLQKEVENTENQITTQQLVADLSKIYKSQKIPIPPPHLRFRISGTSDEGIFVLNGIQGSTQMMHYVDKYDHSSNPSILDWGCGCGRYAHNILKKWPHVLYTGCDIDEEAITWCQDNIKGGHFKTIGLYPPTSFTDEQFSSVIGSSVMTHLSKKNQELWLKEMARILKPNGIFVASVLGFTAAAKIWPVKTILSKKGFVDYNNDPALSGIIPDGYYRDVFQTEEYTRLQWSEHFEIKEYLPAGLMGYQDLVVLQKKEVSTPINRKKDGWFKRLFQ
jgi:SAM-dependent methyltransferase